MIRVVAAIPAVSYVWFLIQGTGESVDFFTTLDRYGFPTAALIITVWFIWNRQKKSDAERNDLNQERNNLIATNNDLTKQLIATVERGNQCMYKIEHAQHDDK